MFPLPPLKFWEFACALLGEERAKFSGDQKVKKLAFSKTANFHKLASSVPILFLHFVSFKLHILFWTYKLSKEQISVAMTWGYSTLAFCHVWFYGLHVIVFCELVIVFEGLAIPECDWLFTRSLVLLYFCYSPYKVLQPFKLLLG